MVECPGGGAQGRPACFDLDEEIGAAVLPGLERADGAVELDPFPAVGGGHLEHALGDAEAVAGQPVGAQVDEAVEQVGPGSEAGLVAEGGIDLDAAQAAGRVPRHGRGDGEAAPLWLEEKRVQLTVVVDGDDDH